MKLLFDQNLSPKLVEQLSDLFPGSSHVQNEGLACATDYEIWEHAVRNRYSIVTKDEDFNDLGALRGYPPKVIWLALGNCTTAQVEVVLRSRFADIEAFESDLTAGTLALR
jgi:predicted nuclease of predicted toxin-antitoxin system